MTKPYVRPTVAGWLVPVMLGPWISTYGAVTAYAFLFGPERDLTRWGLWILGMGLGTLFAGVYVLALVLVDVLLLAIRQRILPTGGRAWLMAVASPLVPLASYAVLKPWTFYKYGWWGIAAVLLVPILASTATTRVAFGLKTQVAEKD